MSTRDRRQHQVAKQLDSLARGQFQREWDTQRGAEEPKADLTIKAQAGETAPDLGS